MMKKFNPLIFAAFLMLISISAYSQVGVVQTAPIKWVSTLPVSCNALLRTERFVALRIAPHGMYQCTSLGVYGPVGAGSGTNVASAATITPTGNSFTVTGVTTITSISTVGLTTGAVIRLIFNSTAQLTDGGNLILAGNFVGGANRTISLLYDGTNFQELGRSTN